MTEMMRFTSPKSVIMPLVGDWIVAPDVLVRSDQILSAEPVTYEWTKDEGNTTYSCPATCITLLTGTQVFVTEKVSEIAERLGVAR